MSMKTAVPLFLAFGMFAAVGCAGETGSTAEEVGREVAGAGGSVQTATSGPAPGPARAWHDSVMQAMGGQEAWEKVRYLQFRWNVFRNGEIVSDRRHHWDRYTGDYRIETVMPDGDSLRVLFNVETREGRAWVGGRQVSDARADSLIDRGHAMFINDSYWLLMPYKWSDPGVNLEYLGTETHEDGTWRVLHLSFEDVGRTPGDRYWAYVDDDPPHLMRKWQYHLQSQDEKGAMIRWEDWQEFGPIKLATRRVPAEDGGFRIEFHEIRVSTEVPEGVFTAQSGS